MTNPPARNGKQKGARKGKGKRGGGLPASSDLSVAAGRGRNIPRANLGRDTLLGLAQSQRRTLCLVSAASFATGAGTTYQEAQFILNGVFNVVSGQQPVGFAKYMAFYSKAFVLGAHAHVRGAGRAITTQAVYSIGCNVSTNSTPFASTQAAIENGMVDYRVCLTNPDRFDLSNAVDVAKFLNKPRILDDPQLFSTSAANPTQLVVLHVFGQNIGTPSSVDVEYLVEMEFDVVFTDPIPFT